MNPTDKVDDLLAKAGAEWRASQPAAPEPDLDRITGAKQRKRRWLVPTLAAASVAAIATAALIVLPDHNEPTVAPPPSSALTPMTAQGTATAGKPSAEDLLVHNGDKVEVNGQIIAAPGQDPVFCPPVMSTLPVIEPGNEPVPECGQDLAVKLIGFDPGRLTDAQTINGVRVGKAHAVGIWKDKTITVEEQTAYRTPPPWMPPQLPCPAPPGGWQWRQSNLMTKQVQNFLDAKADAIYGPITHNPNGAGRRAAVVISIGVAHGDVDAFRKSFETIYQGNLCVFKAKLSRTDNRRIGDAVTDVMIAHRDLGIFRGGGQGADGDRITVSMLVFDESAKAAFEPVGLAYLDLEVQVKPVR